MTALLQVRNLTRRFGGLVANDTISMDVESGGIHGLIGPNGAGKTTFFNLISGAIRPSGGTVVFDGADVTGWRSDQLAAIGITRTFQNLKLFDDLDVLTNVKIGTHVGCRDGIFGALFGTSSHQREERDCSREANDALSFVGLNVLGGEIASALPYGHKRILEIARAVVSRPKLLLLDEPAAGLNPTEVHSLATLIKTINARGTTIILVEHHMDLIMGVCSQITVLSSGRKIAEGTPGEIQKNSDVIEAYLGESDVSGSVLI